MNGFQRKAIERAVANMDKLNDWEKGFISSISEAIKMQGDDFLLSADQNTVLNKISEKMSKSLNYKHWDA